MGWPAVAQESPSGHAGIFEQALGHIEQQLHAR
jgi:hypothetical protein